MLKVLYVFVGAAAALALLWVSSCTAAEPMSQTGVIANNAGAALDYCGRMDAGHLAACVTAHMNSGISGPGMRGTERHPAKIKCDPSKGVVRAILRDVPLVEIPIPISDQIDCAAYARNHPI